MREFFFVLQLKDTLSYLKFFSRFFIFFKRLGRYWFWIKELTLFVSIYFLILLVQQSVIKIRYAL